MENIKSVVPMSQRIVIGLKIDMCPLRPIRVAHLGQSEYLLISLVKGTSGSIFFFSAWLEIKIYFHVREPVYRLERARLKC